MTIEDELTKSIQKAISALGIEQGEVLLEHPADVAHGDYSTNVALRYAKELKKSPKELAGEIAEELKIQNSKILDRVTVAGPGFINFYLSKEFFAEAVGKVGEDFGKSKRLLGKKIMVEYTDPNPFKPFHIGHLMSNAIGESIARLIEAEGATVVRACWQGDVGLHVAKAIFGMQKQIQDSGTRYQDATAEEWGNAYVAGASAYDTDETAKGEINVLNKVIFEKSDSEVNQLYDAGRQVSLEHFEELYALLGTAFTYYFFEGKEGRDGISIVQKGLKDGVFEESDGAIVYKGEKVGLHTRVFLTSKGLPTYEAKELGLNTAKFKVEPDLDESIIITANEQSDYFKVVLSAMGEMMSDIAQKTKHVAHGMMRFADSKMSSRKGNVITGETLIQQVKKMVFDKIQEREMSKEEQEEVAKAVAVGAIKYSILRQTIGGDIIFDFEKSISFEGDSGPYLQYSYVRAQAVLHKAKEEGVVGEAKLPSEWVPTLLEKKLYQFPEVVQRSATEYAPHYIVTYLTELAGIFNSWYAQGKIVDVHDPTSPYKVALTQAFAIVMKNGLSLLGIKTPERM